MVSRSGVSCHCARLWLGSPMKNNVSKGLLLCLPAYFCVSLLGVVIKLMDGRVPLVDILFFQSAIAGLLIFRSFLKCKKPTITARKTLLHAVRIASGILCYACVLYVITRIPISVAFLFQYSGALWIPLIGGIFCIDKVSHKVWLPIFIGFMGLLLIVKPEFNIAYLVFIIGVLAGVFQAMSIIAIRVLLRTDPIQLINFSFFVTTTVFTLPYLILHPVPFRAHPELIVLVFALGVLTAIAQRLIVRALTYAPAAVMGSACYIAVVISGILDWLLWGVIPGKTSLIGMGLVVLGCLGLVFIKLDNSGKSQPV